MHHLIRSSLLQSVEDAGDYPILLSGGIDSASVLAAALELGRRPKCYTFVTDRHTSEDYRIAREMTKRYYLDHTICYVTTDLHSVQRDVENLLPFIVDHGSTLLPDAHIIYKVWVEVLRPMTYVIRRLKADGVERALTGFCADAYYGSGVAANKILQYEGLDAWHDYRVKYVEHPLNADWVVKSWAKTQGVDLHDCWAQPTIRKTMLGFFPPELHKPKTKWCAVQAFPSFWLPSITNNRHTAEWYRPNASLQVNSGVREDHEALLSSPINTNNRKAVIALYYDMAERLGLDPRGKERAARCKGQGDLFSL